MIEDDGLSKCKAESEVYEQYLPRMNKRLCGLLVKFMCHVRKMKKDSTYKKIVLTAERLRIDDKMDYEESICCAVKIRKLLLMRTLRCWKPNLSDEEEEEEEEV